MQEIALETDQFEGAPSLSRPVLARQGGDVDLFATNQVFWMEPGGQIPRPVSSKSRRDKDGAPALEVATAAAALLPYLA